MSQARSLEPFHFGLFWRLCGQPSAAKVQALLQPLPEGLTGEDSRTMHLPVTH